MQDLGGCRAVVTTLDQVPTVTQDLLNERTWVKHPISPVRFLHPKFSRIPIKYENNSLDNFSTDDVFLLPCNDCA